MATQTPFRPGNAFVRVAAACPEVALGNVSTNTANILRLYRLAAKQHASLVVFPELSLTGYTIGDLVQHAAILNGAMDGLVRLAEATKNQPTAMVVGLPFAFGNGIYNCAAVLASGKVQGLVPKTAIPNYKEFYEKRWYQPWSGENTTTVIDGQSVPFGTQLIFLIGRARLGIEICEDLWSIDPPSNRLTRAGATIIANPSASPEQLYKSNYRRQLVSQQSARTISAYVYAGCDASESTTDIVMSGHQLIAENGKVLAERLPLSADNRLTVNDIDIDHLLNDRRKDTNFGNTGDVLHIDCGLKAKQTDLRYPLDRAPFVPDDASVLEDVLAIQVQGLATRARNTGVTTMILGLSGGLDSTLVLLVAVHCAKQLGIPAKDLVQTITMPGPASSDSTQTNASKLARALGVPNEVIPIGELVNNQLRALGHDTKTEDTTYENVQARIRTALLFNRANQTNGMVLGTGDLSEIALGWCTYNGDHMSHYNVNASIPKTLVRHLVAHMAARAEYAKARPILQAILDTPISPELTHGNGTGQHTESLIGPYELHDFFLYHFIRWNDEPAKIAYLAEQAFVGKYTMDEIAKWLQVFLNRFMSSQWKRSVAVDGPKVGSVSLSPRGDWRAPSDMRNYPEN